MWGRRARRERRLRERGRPAWATVASSAPAGDGRRRLRLRVAPGDGEPFDAVADIALGGGREPEAGDRVEVLHVGRDRHVMAVGHPAPPPAPPPETPSIGPAPDVAAVLRGLVRALGDGSLAAGMPLIVEGEAPPRTAADPSPEPPDLAALTLDALAAYASGDARGALDEATRRVRAGEATTAEVLAAARRAGLAPADLP